MESPKQGNHRDKEYHANGYRFFGDAADRYGTSLGIGAPAKSQHGQRFALIWINMATGAPPKLYAHLEILVRRKGRGGSKAEVGGRLPAYGSPGFAPT